VATGLAIVARDAVLVLFSSRWDAAIAPMSLLALSMGANAVGAAFGDIFWAMGKPALLVKIDAPLAATLLVAFVLVAPHGITAVAAAHLLCYAVYSLVSLVVASREIGVSAIENAKALWPGLCASFGIAAASLPVHFIMGPGRLALPVTVAAGVAGALAALAVGSRSSFEEAFRLLLVFRRQTASES
jgi:O-antigen/teichoic acid export membrane protein